MASKELVMMIAELEPKRARFLRGLMEGKSQTAAYQDAYGCQRDSARANAVRVMANDSFRTVYQRAVAECFDGLIDGLKEMSPIVLRRIREILVGENEAVVVRLIDSILDRLGVVRTERREYSVESADQFRARILADIESGVQGARID